MTKDPGEMVRLVDRMTGFCWGGLPAAAHDPEVVHALLATCFPPNLEARVQIALAFELAQALDLLRRQQAPHWQN
jgi:hypothetical protein